MVWTSPLELVSVAHRLLVVFLTLLAFVVASPAAPDQGRLLDKRFLACLELHAEERRGPLARKLRTFEATLDSLDLGEGSLTLARHAKATSIRFAEPARAS